MVRSIFAKQDSNLLNCLHQAAVISDTEHNRLLLQVWISSELPESWLTMLSFELFGSDGRKVACNAEYAGNNLGAECFYLTPEDPNVDLIKVFTVPGDDFCLGVQYVDAVTYDGKRKRLVNDAKSLKDFPCADILFTHPSDLNPGK
jgi:hypothetical protein